MVRSRRVGWAVVMGVTGAGCLATPDRRLEPAGKAGLELADRTGLELAGKRRLEPAERGSAGPEAGELERGEKKVSSGLSYKDRTRVDPAPFPSAAASSFDAERVYSPYDDWEPAIGVDPGSSNVYQLTTRYGQPACPTCPDPAIAFRRSSDGGATWEADRYFIDSKVNQYDPIIQVAQDGTLYVLFMLEYFPGPMFSRSSDHGSTWTTPKSVSGRYRPAGGDKPVLAISPDGHDVYVGFNASNNYIAASHNSGDTFLAPVKTNNDKRYWFDYQAAVAPDGRVYFAAVDYSQDYSGGQNINVISSGDKGKTWTTTRVDISAEAPDCPWADGCYFGFLGATVGLAVDAAGTVMVAYNASDVDGEPAKLWARTSSDGVQWSERQQISVDSDTVLNQFPVVAAGPTPGDFRVAWQDDREGSTTAWNTWYKSTADGGLTWSDDVRLSDQATGAPYKTAAGYGFPYGDYFEMEVDSSGTAHALWGEGTSYTGPGGTWYTRGK